MRKASHLRGAAARAVALAGLTGLAGLTACSRAGGPPRPVPAPIAVAVEIRKVAFEPAAVRAAPGDTVVWTNHDLVPHTVTARDGRFDSRNLPPDSTWRWVVTGADSTAYSCTYHTTMHGVVRIGARR